MRRKFFYLVLSFFILGLILIMATMVRSSNFINNKLLEEDDKYIASYIDGEYQNELPGKNDGYIVDKIVCDNGAVATWDNEEWGINIRNATQKIKCSLYFRLKNDVTVTYDNNYVVNNIFENIYDTSHFSRNSIASNDTKYSVTEQSGSKYYTFISGSDETEAGGTSGFYLGLKGNQLDSTKTFTIRFEAVGNKNFTSYIGSEQMPALTYTIVSYITEKYQKFSYSFVPKETGYAAFIVYGWLAKEEQRILTIGNLELQEGEYDNYSNISLKEADKLNDTLPTPTRENYTFLGWYTDPIEGDKISGDTVVTKNTTYYAHWQYNEN